MKLVSIYFLFFTFSFVASAQECNEENSYVYASYISDLQAGIDTIHRFNLSFLARELKANGISESEFSDRLSRYTLTIDKLNAKVSIDGSYTPNGYDCNFFVYKVSGSELGYGSYVFVRLIGNQIVNISFEEESIELDGKKLSQLSYKEVK